MSATGADARVQSVIAAFKARYGENSAEYQVAIAPGRVNLIGEHTDYNDGFVLPIAINRDMLLVGAPRNDRQVRVYSLDMQQENVVNLDDITFDESMRWSNYVRGVLHVLQEAGYSVAGMDMVMTGNVPQGAGLSSSAALEVGVLMLSSCLSGFTVPGVEAAKLCQRAENNFVGVNCGIMDQFISRLGAENSALLIDCRSLSYRHIPWSESQVRLLVVDTRVKRGLVDSEYNRRRSECETGVKILAQVIPGIRALRDVSLEQLQTYKHLLPDSVYARCLHVVGENQRVSAAAQALENNAWSRLGSLMYESHADLRDLYQVSCRELDLVVELAQTVSGVYGARMTGAGFGGCAIVLVQEEAVESLQDVIRSKFTAETGHEPGLLLTGAAAGARIL
ncbi:MAG TPA: galactokinase [Firmicutes bacterium]|jgi:galactokinase|nr:galactokinase [Bacillota bacterium]